MVKMRPISSWLCRTRPVPQIFNFDGPVTHGVCIWRHDSVIYGAMVCSTPEFRCPVMAVSDAALNKVWHLRCCDSESCHVKNRIIYISGIKVRTQPLPIRSCLLVRVPSFSESRVRQLLHEYLEKQVKYLQRKM